MQYYSFTKNKRKLASYLYKVFSSSCAKLLASKYSLYSQKKVFKKYGINFAFFGFSPKTAWGGPPSLEATGTDIINLFAPAPLKNNDIFTASAASCQNNREGNNLYTSERFAPAVVPHLSRSNYRERRSIVNASNSRRTASKERNISGAMNTHPTSLLLSPNLLRNKKIGRGRHYEVFVVGIKRFYVDQAKGGTLRVGPESIKVSHPKDAIPPFNIKSYIAGFIDGEGCFHISVSNSPNHKIGYSVSLKFSLILHYRELFLIKLIQAELSGVGRIDKTVEGEVRYFISNLEGLKVLIALLDKYPLLTRKRADYLLFKRAFELVEGKEHLSVEGLNKIVSIKSCMNGNGLSDKLKKEFPALPIMTRPIWEVSSLGEKAIYDPCWLAGFIDAEGCFFVHIRKSAGYKVGYQVSLIFQVSQDMKDKELLQILVKFFGCGKV